MTVVVGIVGEDGTIHLGADSAGTNSNGEQLHISTPKIFISQNPNFIIGSCGCFRFLQILQYAFKPPNPPPQDKDLYQFMSTKFVDALRKTLKLAGYDRKSSSGRDLGGMFIVGVKGQLFIIQDDFQLIVERDNYTAIGAGDMIARASLYSSEDLITDVLDRMGLALSAATYYSAVCREPFVTLSLKSKGKKK